MSEVEEIIREIMKGGDRKVKEIIEAARREAEEIIKKAEKDALEIAEKEARIIRETIANRMMDREKRRLIEDKVRLKDVKIKRLREILYEKIEKVIGGKDERWSYEKILYRLLRDAVLEIGEENIVVSANKRDLEFIRTHKSELETKLEEDVGRKVNLSLGDPVDITGGVICATPSGDKIFNASIDSRVDEVMKKMSAFIARRLGMVSTARFRSLIRQMFEKVREKIKIKDALGRSLELGPIDSVESIIGGETRIDAICKEVGGGIIMVFATLSQATKERVQRFRESIEKYEASVGAKKSKTVFIAFSGVESKDVMDVLRESDMYLLTRKELIDLSKKVGMEM